LPSFKPAKSFVEQMKWQSLPYLRRDDGKIQFNTSITFLT
jgi:hypothetical protein